jgi:predicted nucleic acid-binding protein
MVLIDSSVWIDFFNGVGGAEVTLLEELVRDEQALIGDLILLEVLQGFRSDREFEVARRKLALVPLLILGSGKIAVTAAQNYRALRARGINVRKTIDMVIGTYCIVNGLPLLHADRDFDPMEAHLGLLVDRG